MAPQTVRLFTLLQMWVDKGERYSIMGVTSSNFFGSEALTPICDLCGIALCWDISTCEYEEDEKGYHLNKACQAIKKAMYGSDSGDLYFIEGEYNPSDSWYEPGEG